MWRDEVKAKLLQERTLWCDDRCELEQHGGDDVAILSVTQLSQLLAGEDASALDEGRHIRCHDISPQPRQLRRQSLKRPRAEEASARPLPASAVSFSATRVWVTGFVRHEQATQGQRHATLCLCDAAHRIRVHIVYPALELLDGLVLVKAWTVVRFESDPASLVMEVHGDPVLLHQPHHRPHLSAEDALQMVRTHYTTSDPPLYTGWSTWETILKNSHRQDVAATGTTGKKRKVHTVIGRVTSISPISVQEDASSSHYFVEVEDSETRSIVNILLAGSSSIKWHPFLWPGLLVLFTNLKKVYSAESEIFLLQASVDKSATEGNSNLYVWRPAHEPPRPALMPLEPLLRQRCQSVPGTTVNLEGVVTSVIWDDCVMVESEVPVLAALFHYPWSDIKPHLRTGARIHIYQAHLLHHRSFGGQRRLVAGLCARSHIHIMAHAPGTSKAVPHRPGDHRRRLHKKWSLFGDFGRQPLSISMWWLEMLEVLVQKFQFSTDNHNENAIGTASFKCIRRRAATLAIGQDVFSASLSQSVAALTLARRFLNTHAAGDRDCPSVTDGKSPSDFTSYEVLGLRDIKLSIGSIARERIVQAVCQGEPVGWPIQIEADELSGMCAVGALRGCNDTSDLEIMDQTASVPIILEHSGATAISVDSGCVLYALKKFGALVEVCDSKSEEEGGTECHRLVVSLTASLSDIQRVSLCSNASCALASDPTQTVRHSALVLVTHIGPWKRRQKMRRIVGEYRHVRGVGFLYDDDDSSVVDWDSAHCINLMVSTDCESWFLKKYAWFKFNGTRLNSSSQASEGDSDKKLIQHWQQMRACSEVPTVDTTKPATHQSDKVVETDAHQQFEAIKSASYIIDSSGSVAPVAICPTSPSRSLVEADVSLAAREDVRGSFLSLEELAATSQMTTMVRDLFVVDRPDDGMDVTSSSGARVDPHSARLINIIGVVKERQLYFKAATPATGALESDRGVTPSDAERSQMCRFKIRDLRSPETVFVSVDTDAFGMMSALQPGTVVEVSMLQSFIARASFKPFLTWTHCTTARRVDDMADQVVTDGRLFSQMHTAHLSTLYKLSKVDRTIKRFVVHLAHLSYAVLKRRCSQCKQPLTLLKRQQSWIHANAVEAGAAPNQRSCSWKQIALDASHFHEKTFLSCSLRGVIDDGSAQAELFLENDIVWELLRCSRGQRKRLEDLLVRQTSELSYFATRSPGEALFTTPSMQENLYYQNEWRAFIQQTTASLGAFVVFAQRFYKAPSANAAPPTAVLSFGKDIQITAPSVPLLPLEAVRVDALDPRHELRRRLARWSTGSATGHTTSS